MRAGLHGFSAGKRAGLPARLAVCACRLLRYLALNRDFLGILVVASG